jgi:hypothetical protein
MPDSSTGPPATTDGLPAGSSAARRFGPIVSVIAVVLLSGVLLLRSALTEPLALAAGATALCLLAALAAGTAWSRERRRQAATDDPDLSAAFEAETDAVAADDTRLPAKTELDLINEHASTRLLQLQVRSLASALEELQDLGLDDLRGTTVRGLIDNAALSQGRAVVTVRALSDVLANQSGEAATDRIEAALNRLGAEAWFERPALTRRSGQTFVTFASPPHLGVPEHDVVLASRAVEPPVGDAGIEPGSDAESDAESGLGSPVTAPDDRRVQPVPAPAPVAEAPRSRRRRGRISI